MLSLLALVCWIGGLVLLQVSPWAGASVAAAGFVFAGKAVHRKDDMALLFGLIFAAVIGVSLLRAGLWLWERLV